MKKITVFFFLIASMHGVFAQKRPKQTAVFHYMEVSADSTLVQALRNRIPNLAIVGDSPPEPKDIFLFKYPSSMYQEGWGYIIDGESSTFENFENIDPEDIISFSILRPSPESLVTCHLRDPVVMIKTKKSLTWRELRKLEREKKRAAKKKEN
jgi:hypothetical protein